MVEDAYFAALARMREERTAAIAADNSWLTLAGLYWLQPGENSFGRGPDNTIVLPASAGVTHAGTFILHDGEIRLRAQPDVPIAVSGQLLARSALQPERVLQHDMTGAPDRVTLGDLSMIVIKRGERYGIRLFDNGSPRRATFRGLNWYPVQPAYRITARFLPYEPAKPISYHNVLGDLIEVASPGAILFAWDGVACRLDAQPGGHKLFFNFRDATNGESTYGAGRFLYTDAPQGDGTVLVDFNQATNPYCAYTDYATCPLPPLQNRLPVRIEAGEKKFC